MGRGGALPACTAVTRARVDGDKHAGEGFPDTAVRYENMRVLIVQRDGLSSRVARSWGGLEGQLWAWYHRTWSAHCKYIHVRYLGATRQSL